MVLVWVILSWVLFFSAQLQVPLAVPRLLRNPGTAQRLFERMTRPFLRPFRRLLRRFDTAGIDWSPMVLVLIIWILRRLLRAVMLRLILPR